MLRNKFIFYKDVSFEHDKVQKQIHTACLKYVALGQDITHVIIMIFQLNTLAIQESNEKDTCQCALCSEQMSSSHKICDRELFVHSKVIMSLLGCQFPRVLTLVRVSNKGLWTCHLRQQPQVEWQRTLRMFLVETLNS